MSLYLMSVYAYIHGCVLLICAPVWLCNYTAMSHLTGSVFIWSFNVTTKWHVIYIVFLPIAHCYPSMPNICVGIVLHVVSLCVTCMVPSWNFVYFSIVNVFCLAVFSNCFKMSSTAPVLMFCLTDP